MKFNYCISLLLFFCAPIFTAAEKEKIQLSDCDLTTVSGVQAIGPNINKVIVITARIIKPNGLLFLICSDKANDASFRSFDDHKKKQFNKHDAKDLGEYLEMKLRLDKK